jgi:hypothetical protein
MFFEARYVDVFPSVGAECRDGRRVPFELLSHFNAATLTLDFLAAGDGGRPSSDGISVIPYEFAMIVPAGSSISNCPLKRCVEVPCLLEAEPGLEYAHVFMLWQACLQSNAMALTRTVVKRSPFTKFTHSSLN